MAMASSQGSMDTSVEDSNVILSPEITEVCIGPAHSDNQSSYVRNQAQFVLTNIANAPKQVLDVVQRTDPECISYSPSRHILPLNVLLGNIVKGNACVAGDALHLMLPFVGQGGCLALEDGVVLARCLAEALGVNVKGSYIHAKVKKGLKKYSQERRWRSFCLFWTSYVW